jgi:hypothetical protein
MRKRHSLCSLIVCVVASLTVGSVAGSDTTMVLDDGPHLFWESDTSAIVFYWCDSQKIVNTYTCGDTIRFTGECHDAGIEYAVPCSEHEIAPHVFESVPKVLAVSDIHGEYDHFFNILCESEVIDSAGHWTFGDGHLVVLGDVFDRGPRVTECLWLIYRLEQEAGIAGGMVHFALGNHELMVLRGDNRYIHERYLTGIVKKMRIKHEDFYGPDMELGRWLRSKHTVIRINDIIFVHGGLIPDLVSDNVSMAHINDMIREAIDLTSPRMAFTDSVRYFLGSLGPVWYRGYHYEMEDRYPQATTDQIDSLLEFYGGSAIVVGHSQVDSVQSLYDSRVIAIDVIVEDLGHLEALEWENGRFFRVTGNGRRLHLE